MPGVCELEYDVEFECDDLSCINGTWLCDGEEDCYDGSDESAAYCECPPETVPCADGLLCAPYDFLCDGIEQCLDGSDEFNCTTGKLLAITYNMCRFALIYTIYIMITKGSWYLDIL